MINSTRYSCWGHIQRHSPGACYWELFFSDALLILCIYVGVYISSTFKYIRNFVICALRLQESFGSGEFRLLTTMLIWILKLDHLFIHGAKSSTSYDSVKLKFTSKPQLCQLWLVLRGFGESVFRSLSVVITWTCKQSMIVKVGFSFWELNGVFLVRFSVDGAPTNSK